MVGALTLLFVAILFALQNTQPIRVNLLFVSTEGSAALVLVCTFILGCWWACWEWFLPACATGGASSTYRASRKIRGMRRLPAPPDALTHLRVPLIRMLLMRVPNRAFV